MVVLMESRAKGTRRPYHKKKLVLVLSAMRHFALEQGARGCRVVYGASPDEFCGWFAAACRRRWEWKELVVNRPAERELREELRLASEGRWAAREGCDGHGVAVRVRKILRSVFGKFVAPTPAHGGETAMNGAPGSGGKRTYLMDTFLSGDAAEDRVA